MSYQSFIATRADAGRPIDAVLRTHLSQSRDQIIHLLREGRVLLGKLVCTDGQWRVKRGQRIRVRLFAEKATPKPRSAPPPPRHEGPLPPIRYRDQEIVVVEKPAGLTTMRHPDEAAEFGSRGKRFLPTTLADLLPSLLTQKSSTNAPRVRAVHRLDKETSGLLVFALTPAAESHLGKQFRAHSTDRCYLALVRGKAVSGRIESLLVPDRGDGRRGSGSDRKAGKRAVTHVRVLEEFATFSLVECRLETGRTHQVRIHLGEAGTQKKQDRFLIFMGPSP